MCFAQSKNSRVAMWPQLEPGVGGGGNHGAVEATGRVRLYSGCAWKSLKMALVHEVYEEKVGKCLCISFLHQSFNMGSAVSTPCLVHYTHSHSCGINLHQRAMMHVAWLWTFHKHLRVTHINSNPHLGSSPVSLVTPDSIRTLHNMSQYKTHPYLPTL